MPRKKAKRVYRTQIRVGHKVRVVKSPHNSVPNGTEATVLGIRMNAWGLGKHLYQLDILRLEWWGYDEIERIAP